jgi:TRAP-type C4-dicarboxylate transport system permease small subunit
MGELAGGLVGIWILSRLARLALRRLPHLGQPMIVVLSVAIALAAAVAIAHPNMESQAAQFGYTTWGYALLVYGPGALFWLIFDLFRLRREKRLAASDSASSGSPS